MLNDDKKSIDNLQKFGQQFQIKCIICLLTDQTFIERIYDIIEPTFFESEAQQWVVQEIIDYFIKFKALPTADVFRVGIDRIQNEVLKVSVKETLRTIYANITSRDIDFVKNEFLKFCQNQKMSRAILDSVPLLERGEYEQIYNIVGTAMNAGKERNLGHNYLNDIDLRMSNISRKSIKTNWPLIDDIMDGGLAAGELGVITACAGAGKCVGPDTILEVYYNKRYYKISIDSLFKKLNVKDEENYIKDTSKLDLTVKTPYGYKKIITAFRTENQQSVRIKFENGEILVTSNKHMFSKGFVENSKQNYWVHVDDLQVGDSVLGEDDKLIKITEITYEDYKILYDISVEDVHCYYSNGILSHNSWILAKIGSEAMKQGYNVLHITLELNEIYVGIRYDSCFTGVDFQNIKDNIQIVKDRLRQMPGRLFIKYFPIKTVSATDIKMHIDRLKMCGFDVDLLIVDYADILCTRNAQKNSNSYSEAGSIYEELRGVAGELKIPCWTASQSSRSAMGEDIIQADTIADSYRKIMTADFVMSLSRKMEDKLCNTARFHVIKNRFGPDGVTFPAKLNASCGKVDLFDPKSPEGMALLKGMKNSEDSFKKLMRDRLHDLNKDYDE